MSVTYPLPEHRNKLEYPFAVFGTDPHTGKFIMEMDEEGILEELEAMRRENDFRTYWNVEGVDQRYMDQPVLFEVKSLEWESCKLVLPPPDRFITPFTWFDLWKLCDTVLRTEWALCGPDDHRYIVGFIPLGDGAFKIALDS